MKMVGVCNAAAAAVEVCLKEEVSVGALSSYLNNLCSLVLFSFALSFDLLQKKPIRQEHLRESRERRARYKASQSE